MISESQLLFTDFNISSKFSLGDLSLLSSTEEINSSILYPKVSSKASFESRDCITTSTLALKFETRLGSMFSLPSATVNAGTVFFMVLRNSLISCCNKSKACIKSN